MPIRDVKRANEFIELLRGRVSDRTFSHCLGTGEFMSALVPYAGIDRDTAVTTGLLHDLCKGIDDATMLAEAARYGIPVRETQRYKPGLLHGPVAAEEIRRTLGIEDETVHEAIHWHTTGCPGLRTLGLALYVADFAEKTRDYDDAAEARKILSTQGFREAVLFVSRRKFDYVRKKPHVDPTTEAFHAWLETEWV